MLESPMFLWRRRRRRRTRGASDQQHGADGGPSTTATADVHHHHDPAHHHQRNHQPQVVSLEEMFLQDYFAVRHLSDDSSDDRTDEQQERMQHQQLQQRRPFVAQNDRTQAILEQLLTGTVLKTDSTVIYADLGEHNSIHNNEAAELVALSEWCPICLEDWQHGEEIKCTAQCKHAYHAHCIAQWLDTNNTNGHTTTNTENNNSKECPCCRSQLDGNTTAAQSSNTAAQSSNTAATRPRLRLPTYESNELDEHIDDDDSDNDLDYQAFRNMIRVDDLDTIAGRSDDAVMGRPSTPLFGHSTNMNHRPPQHGRRPPTPQFALPSGGESRRSVNTDDTVVVQPEVEDRSATVAVEQPPSSWNVRRPTIVDLEDVIPDGETTTESTGNTNHRPYQVVALPLKERIRPLLDSEAGAPTLPPQNSRIIIGNQVWDPRQSNSDHCVLCNHRFHCTGRYTMSQDFECMHLFHEECLLDYACRYLVEHDSDNESNEGGLQVIGNVAVRAVPCICCERPYVCVPEAIIREDTSTINDRRQRMASF